MLCGQAYDGGGQDSQGGFVVLADDQEIAAALPAKRRGRRILDRHRFAEPGMESARRAEPHGGRQKIVEQMILGDVSRGISLKYDLWTRDRWVEPAITLLQANQVILPAFLGQPNDLERIIAFD